jgi:hypothetical protein
MSELLPGFRTVRASDVNRDGMYLELIEHRTGDAVAEVFYSDSSNLMTISLFKPNLPLNVVESLINKAKQDLPPASEQIAKG